MPHKIEFGVGTASYMGDLSPSPSALNLNLGLGFRYYIKNKLSVRAKVNYFRLKASDQKSGDVVRNLSFRSDNLQVGLQFVYDFFHFYANDHKRKRVTPYVFTGIQALFFNPKTQYNGVWYELQVLNTEGKNYAKTTLCVPLGIGFRIKLTPNVDLGLELSYQQTFTDYLDDVSGNYRDNREMTGIAATLADRTSEGGNTPSETRDGKHWKEGSKRGTSTAFDSFILTEFTLEFNLVKPDVRCPLY